MNPLVGNAGGDAEDAPMPGMVRSWLRGPSGNLRARWHAPDEDLPDGFEHVAVGQPDTDEDTDPHTDAANADTNTSKQGCGCGCGGKNTKKKKKKKPSTGSMGSPAAFKGVKSTGKGRSKAKADADPADLPTPGSLKAFRERAEADGEQDKGRIMSTDDLRRARKRKAKWGRSSWGPASRPDPDAKDDDAGR